ncbi:MAG: phosphoribosyltransferase family protein [Gemmataceae bacterium]
MFRNREEAGRLLAARLHGRRLHDPVVLAIPRGGVVVGAMLAKGLGADLDIVLARKLRDPWQPELALGALAESGEVILNPELADRSRELEGYLEKERRYQEKEIERLQTVPRRARRPCWRPGR